MPRQPIPGKDDGTWGGILNDYLLVSLSSDGTIAPNTVGSTQLVAGSIPASKLDNATQAQLATTAPVISVNTKTGVVSLTKTDVGLGSVDNTSDLNKPVSTAQNAAFVGFWKPATAYLTGQIAVSQAGNIVTANSNFTSGASYLASDWTVVSGGLTQAAADALYVKLANSAPLSNVAPQPLGPVALAGTAPTAMRSDAVFALPAGTSSPYGVFGDGFSGPLYFDGIGDIPGYTRVGSIYTHAPDEGFNGPDFTGGPTQSILATNVTVLAGVTLRMPGSPLYATGLLTNNGVIEAPVNNAVADVTGAGITQGYMQTLMSSRTGPNGGIGAGALNGNYAESLVGSFSHAGGNGGSGGLGSAGIGGTIGGTPVGSNIRALLHAAPTCFQPCVISAYDGNVVGSNGGFKVVGGILGGVAGGSGGGDGTNKGGAGGPSGGVLAVHARHLTGTGVFRALGGNGGNGGLGNCGGGGGGGGGAVIVNTTSITGWTGTLSTEAGTGGTKSGTGVAGTPGARGVAVLNVFV